MSIDGENGLLAELTKLVVESALEGETTDHLGYDKHERGASTDGNARNGTRSKTVISKAGPVVIDVPRDRAGTFEPQIGNDEGLVDVRVYAASVAEGFMMSSNSTGVSFPSRR